MAIIPPAPEATGPLIVTAALDGASFAILDGLRRLYFPKRLNVIPAHVSLFHRLPGDEVAAVSRVLASTCGARHRFTLEPDAPMFLGRGVAYRYASNDLVAIRDTLARVWEAWLSPQDRQGFRAHVTLQNKVDPDTARALFETMRTYEAPVCEVLGLTLWRYLGGPWERIETFPFADAQVDEAARDQ